MAENGINSGRGKLSKCEKKLRKLHLKLSSSSIKNLIIVSSSYKTDKKLGKKKPLKLIFVSQLQRKVVKLLLFSSSRFQLPF